MPIDTMPILYSFRRCPYAMRARLAIRYAQQTVVLREIVLKDKPPQMVAISPKATVPVLQLPDGRVIDQSIDIAYWALENNDPFSLLPKASVKSFCDALIHECDFEFKPWLDKYKYADRHPEQSAEYYRNNGERFLKNLASILQEQPFLLGATPTLADIAIMPFIRQFSMVDLQWFKSCQYPRVRDWLNDWLESDSFRSIMSKYEKWHETQEIIEF